MARGKGSTPGAHQPLLLSLGWLLRGARGLPSFRDSQILPPAAECHHPLSVPVAQEEMLGSNPVRESGKVAQHTQVTAQPPAESKGVFSQSCANPPSLCSHQEQPVPGTGLGTRNCSHLGVVLWSEDTQGPPSPCPGRREQGCGPQHPSVG